MSTMSRTEHDELAGIVKRNFRVARASIDQQKARVMADFEAALAHQWDPVELAAEELIREAQAAVARANRHVAERFVQLGLPKDWAPRAIVHWSSRGDNMFGDRRAELRRAATTRAEAQAKDAKLELDKREAELLTTLATTALTSEAARAFLGQVPALAELIPPLEVEPGPPLEAVKALLGRRPALSAKRAAAGRAGGRASAKSKQVATEPEQVAGAPESEQ